MKVLDLQCSHGHVFEGWFASEDDFQSQKHRQLVLCPLCNDHQVHKRLSAPRLNLGAREPANARLQAEADPRARSGGARGEGAQSVADLPNGYPGPMSPAGGDEVTRVKALQAAWLHVARHIANSTEDVGSAFAQEARRIHHGEAPERGIRGQATVEETLELMEEGVSVVPLPFPIAAKETLQ